jgi:hypothetical protein
VLPPSWSGFAIGPKLNDLARAGKISTVSDVIGAFEEIANALREVADGK